MSPNGNRAACCSLIVFHHVRFSLWNSQQATAAEGAKCSGFAGEGVGFTCTLDFEFQSQAEYTVRMILTDVEDPAGPWWQGSLIDSTGEEHVIGQIEGPSGLGLIRGAVSWIEFFGLDADDTCQCLTLPPVAEALFRRPLINASTYVDYAAATRGGCSGGRVTPIPDYLCSRIELGVDKTSTRGPFGRPVYGPLQCVACLRDAECPSGELCGCNHACYKPD